METTRIRERSKYKVASYAVAALALLGACGSKEKMSDADYDKLPKPASQPLEDYTFPADPEAGSVKELLLLEPRARNIMVQNFNEPGENQFDPTLVYDLPNGQRCTATTERPEDPTETPDDLIHIGACYTP